MAFLACRTVPIVGAVSRPCGAMGLRPMRLVHGIGRLTAACALCAMAALHVAAQPAAAPIGSAAAATTMASQIDRFKGDAHQQIESYGELAYRTYQDAHRAGLVLERAVQRLIAKPDAAALAAARRAWLAA